MGKVAFEDEKAMKEAETVNKRELKKKTEPRTPPQTPAQPVGRLNALTSFKKGRNGKKS